MQKQSPGRFQKTRQSRVLRAVQTSILSKGITAFQQLIAMPVAIRILGPVEFGIFAAVSALFALFSIAEVGIGPKLIRSIGVAATQEDAERERTLVASALVLVGGAALLVCAAYGTVFLTGFYKALISERFAVYDSQILKTAAVFLIAGAMTLVGNVFVRCLNGLQLTHFGNLAGAAGIALSSALLVGALWWIPSAVDLAIAIQIAPVATGILAMMIVRKIRPSMLRLSLRNVRLPVIKELAWDGAIFTVVQLATLLERESAKLVFAKQAGPAALGHVAALLQFTISLGGLAVMLTTAYFPSIVEASVQRDKVWLFQVAKRMRWLAGGGGLLMIICGTVVGPTLLQLVLGASYHYPPEVVFAFLIYFALCIWNHWHTMMIMALGRGAVVAKIISIELGLFIVLLFAVNLKSELSVLVVLLLPLLFYTAPFVYRANNQAIREL